MQNFSSEEKKILIISDLHLTKYFNQRKFDYLQKLISKCDQLIVNGDFWSHFTNSFEDFVKSKWKDLFPLMLEKNCIYICGNHDREKWLNDKTNQFAVEVKEAYSLNYGDLVYVIKHGCFTKKGLRADAKLTKLYRKLKLDKTADVVHFAILNILGTKAYKMPGRVLNNVHRALYKRKLSDNEVLVAGHTHSAEYRINKKYINTGFIGHGYASYLWMENNRVSLLEERYH